MPPQSLPTEETTKNHFQFINLWQTAEERKQKYWLARSMGASWDLARRCRDWRLSKIERLFKIEPSNYHNRQQHDTSLNEHISSCQPTLS